MMTDDDTDTTVSEFQIAEENDLPVIQLFSLVEELSYGNSALKTETEMFQKYLNKLESREQRMLRLSDIKISGTDFSQLRGRRKSKSRSGPDRTSSLSVDQKCDLVRKELEDTKEEIRHLRANAERDLQHHEAIIEEAEIRMAEVQKAMQEFEKDILKTIAKKKGSILATQKVLKYIEDANRRRDNMKDKLRLKNVSLKVSRKKMLLQLRQSRPSLVAPPPWSALLKTGCAVLFQTRLHRAMEMSSNLEKEILLRHELLEKIEREILQVEEDRAKAEALNKQLRRQMAEFRAPPVMTYVKEKIFNGDLEKTIRVWERKVEIAEMSLKGYRKDWNKMKATNEKLQLISPPGK
ncbi:PREDICTED: coiled-coil domain-containing protein 113 [Myotis brandtii]|uniref:coiled-coil domain-containing protein 113 n=1 Tax=Myotis brandtii TaxID=109478 RepID=UPI00070436FB|nr:PREDICTED: coiled-coil domain-containing protein 113 [Myotis brandtii]